MMISWELVEEPDCVVNLSKIIVSQKGRAREIHKRLTGRLSSLENNIFRSSSMPKTFGKAVQDFPPPPLKSLPANCQTPYDFHRLFLDDEFIDQVVASSQQYAVRRNRPEEGLTRMITPNGLRISMAILYMTGYTTPSHWQLYWEQREDTMNVAVRKAMPRNTFREIIRHTCFTDADREEENPGDRFWKVRPLFDQLNKSAAKFVRQTERVSIAKGTVKHPLKQDTKGGGPHPSDVQAEVYILHRKSYSPLPPFGNHMLSPSADLI